MACLLRFRPVVILGILTLALWVPLGGRGDPPKRSSGQGSVPAHPGGRRQAYGGPPLPSSLDLDRLGTEGLTLTVAAVGDPLPRIQCAQSALRGDDMVTVYAQGLSAPDGLAFSPAGILYVAEEGAGRVSQIGPGGVVTPAIEGLNSPEGVAFDGAGNLYAVEDVPSGRLIRRTAAGVTETLAAGLDAPEDVVWAMDGMLYVSESNAQFVQDPTALRSRIAVISPSGAVTRILTHTSAIDGTSDALIRDVTFWSYAGLAAGPGGLLYVTNELSGQEITRTVVVVPGILTLTFRLSTTESILAMDPATGAQSPFASGLSAPEGLHFAASGGFPLYVAEESVAGGGGRLSRVQADGSHVPLCTGFYGIEDVAVDGRGWLYVSEDTTGLIILIQVEPEWQVWLPAILHQ